MAPAVGRSGAVVGMAHASGLHGVERSLDALHDEMLRSAADDAGHVRLSVLNVVAACVDDRAAELAIDVLTSIGARHPARVIVIRAYPDAADTAIEADVSLQRTPVGGHDVYTELMHLTVKGEPSFHLSSIVAPLLIPEIPTDLWVVGAPRLVQAFSDDAVTLCDRIILDSGAYPSPAEPLGRIAAEFERRGSSLMIGDFAWERTRIWRELIAQAFEVPGAVQWLAHVRELRLEVSGDHVPAQGWLLAGWFASRLRWQQGAEPVSVHTLDDGDGGEAVLRSVRIRLSRGSVERAVALVVHRELLRVSSDLGGVEVSRTVPHSEPSVTSLMSRLMDESREDPIYPEAVTRAVALIR
jgi:glucose-6-phosphate dehydrogenase assembly protein OpcA